MKIIIEYQYLAPVCLFSILYKNSNIVFERCEHFQKRSFRNRCLIAGADGPISLSIPVIEGRGQKKRVTEVLIDYRTNWQMQHWKAIQTSYRRSPWFSHYGPSLEELFFQHVDLLVEWNERLFAWTILQLKMKISMEATEEYEKEYTDEYIDLRSRLLPKNYADFLVPKYPQVFEDRTGFLNNLSVLDILFNLGPAAATHLAL